MLNLRKILTGLKPYLRYPARSKSSDLVVVSAVRTPLANFENYDIPLESQLITFSINGSIKHSALPRQTIDCLHIVSSDKPGDVILHSLCSDLLKKDVARCFYSDETEALQIAIDKLKNGQAKSIIVTGVSVIPANNFNEKSSERLDLATSKGLYDEEVIAITLKQKNKQLVTLTKDAYTKSIEAPYYTAASVALTTNENAVSLNMKPLARLLNFTHSYNKDNSSLIKELLITEEVKIEDVHRWEMDSNDFENYLSFSHTNSIPGIFGSSAGNSLILQLTHLVHCLRSKQLGGLLTSRTNGSRSGILLDNPNEISDNTPLLTLYTKNPCPLCDLLIEELELKFNGEYRLEKVYIDIKENLRFLRLYRYDIPVLFLNGQFLCMHRLNSALLRRKIDEINNKRLERMIT